MIYREQFQELVDCLDEIREDLTDRLEEGDCTKDEEDLISSVITNLSESIDDILMFMTEVSE